MAVLGAQGLVLIVVGIADAAAGSWLGAALLTTLGVLSLVSAWAVLIRVR